MDGVAPCAGPGGGRGLSAAARRALLLLLLGLVAVGSARKYREEFHPANEAGRVHAAMAIVDHGSLRLDEVWDDVYPGWRDSGRLPNADAAVRDGHYLLDKPPGVTLLVVPVIAFLRLAGIDPGLASLLWVLALLLAALAAVLFLLAFLRWLRESFGERAGVLLVAPAVVLATPWLLFGSQAVGHSLAAALAGVGALLALGRLDATDPGGHPVRGGLLGGLALGGAVLSESSAALLALGAALALLADPARRRRLPWLVLGGLGPALVFLAWNQASFGDPFAYGYAFKASPGMAAAHGQGILGLGAPRLDAMWGLLFSARRGLFFHSPWLLLAPIGAVWACRDAAIARAWRLLALLGVLVVPVLLAGFADWHGGGTLGPRYLVFVLPLFGVGAALAVDRLSRSARGRIALAAATGLLLSSVALQLVANAGIPSVDQLVANPMAEVVIPVLSEAGPVGTVWDPLVGTTLGALIAIAAAIAVLLRVGRGVDARPILDAWRPSRRLAAGLFLGAIAVHALAVAIPRTTEPPGRTIVLRARLGAYRFLGNGDLSRRTEREILRVEQPERYGR